MKMKGFLYHIVSFAVPLLTAALLCAVRAEAKSAMSRQDRQMKVVAIEAGAPGTDDGDRQPPATEKDGEDNYMQYIVSGKDTMYLDQLPAAKVYERLPRQKGREWRFRASICRTRTDRARRRREEYRRLRAGTGFRS